MKRAISLARSGPFLQKKEKPLRCLVAETPNSPAVATRYGKVVPVTL